MVEVKAVSEAVWWGGCEVPAGHTARWRIGPLHLSASRGEQEWRIISRRETSPLDTAMSFHIEAGLVVEEEGAEINRFGFRHPPSGIRLQPLLADRSVVVKPDTPLYVAAGEEITLFISTPLWLQLFTGDQKTPLSELPIYRPSDTWMGSSTMEGELCYSGTTSAKLKLEELVRRPHRAITPIVIRNHADDALRIEKLNVPVRLLSLQADERGTFWTPPVLLSRDKTGEMGTVRIQGHRLELPVKTMPVAAARDHYEENIMRRALARFVG